MKQKHYNKILSVTKPIKATVLVLVGLSNYVMGSLEYGFKEIETSQTNEAIIKGLTLRTAKLLNDGMFSTLSASKYIAFKALGFLKLVNIHEADPRILTINHERDNIPLLGKALFQNSNPQELKLNSLIEEVEKFINPWKNLLILGKKYFIWNTISQSIITKNLNKWMNPTLTYWIKLTE